MSSIDFDSIPEEIKKYPNWILWKLEEKKNKDGKVDIDPETGKPKKTKIPYQVNGKWAKSNDSKTWSTLENVKQTFLKSNGKYSGIGFVFEEKLGIKGIDFDHVHNPETGEFDTEALEEILSFGSYAELSQSRTGVHVIIKGNLPEYITDAGRQGRRKELDNGTGREIYQGPQYFTFTGWNIEGTPKEITENQESINRFVLKHWPRNERKDSKKVISKTEVKTSLKMSDDEVVKHCMSAKNSEKFKALFNGNISGYDSHNEADQALCFIIAFYTKDPGQIDSIFRKSGLYRDKWERDDYRNDTIDNALQGVTETYNPGKKGKGKPEKIIVHFDEVADRALKQNHIFSMRDNGQIYLYKDGVYKNEGTEAILGTQIRDAYYKMYQEKWMDINSDFDLPDHIPKATTKYVNEVLEYIRSYTHVSRKEIDYNQDRYINFENGLFDLEEWKLIEHDPEILNIAQIKARYEPEAKCPEITKYFKTCELPGQSITVLEEFSGYCLTTDVKLQKAVMLYGNGANGKSVFINLLKTILGPDFVSGESLQNLEIDKYRVANLYGKRLNAFPDLKDSPLQTNEVFNTLTGNDLELTGERKYQHDFRFKPTAKLLFSANKIPFAYSDNYAYYRRWILIEFPKTFERDEIDENIIEKMTTEEEKSGFINLMLEGLKRLLQNRRFSYDLGVDEIEKQYLLHSDNVPIFEETCLRDCEGIEEPNSKKEVYDFYLMWCNYHKINPVKPKTFTKKLDKIGRKVHNTTTYNPETKKGEWFSCYYNTRITINYRPTKNRQHETTQAIIDNIQTEECLERSA